MANQLIINSTPEEARVALKENNKVVELYFERRDHRSIVGNIYKGKVVKVLPGMQAAFIDISENRTAFLYVRDIFEEFEELNELEKDNITKTRKKKSTFNDNITELLKAGQEILVQVLRGPLGTKGARVTSHISLPGRNLVFMPTVNHTGVSNRIYARKERVRLKNIVREHKPNHGGIIVRTACEGKDEKAIKADLKHLEDTWNNILDNNKKKKAPALLHMDDDLVIRAVRDLATDEVSEIIIDSKDSYKRVNEYIKKVIPDFKSKVKHFNRKEPIFEAYVVENEIRKVLKPKIWLKSGGDIKIDQTEAMTVVDVNTGKFVGKKSLEDTILRTNLEAAKTIADQLRFRNIGGIIIIDFIDMENRKNRDVLFRAFQEELKEDKARTTISHISELGLVEMTRKRTREDLMRALTEACYYCGGSGVLKSSLTLCYEIFRGIRHKGKTKRDKNIVITLHEKVLAEIEEEKQETIKKLSKEFKKNITLKKGAEYRVDEYKISTY